MGDFSDEDMVCIVGCGGSACDANVIDLDSDADVADCGRIVVRFSITHCVLFNLFGLDIVGAG